MAKCDGRNYLIAIASMALIMVNSDTWLRLTSAQGVKGGSSFFSNSQQVQQVPQSTGNQFSSSFVQMFNSLTPTEQQQFIKQMSSSNRRVFQQALQPQTNSFINEEVSSSSGGSSPFISGGSISSSGSRFGGTKSSSSFSKQVSSQNQIIPSPVQQFFKQQKSSSQSFVQPTIQPSTSSFEFSRQVSSAIQPQQIVLPQTSNEQSFQSTKSIIAQPQPQQQSFFNQVQRVQQVAQPVVLPSTEQFSRRFQSFQSQPVPVQQEAQSGFTSQQFFQQIQPQPVKSSSSSFNRRVQQVVVPQPVVNNQFSSVSSSSNLGGTIPFDQSSGGFSANFQQEKVDFPVATGGNFEQNQFVQTQNGFVPVTTGTINQSSLQESGFDSSDVQQRNLPGNFIGEDGGGITAASINNKWYMMKPIENPKALGLEDARSASGSLRRISLGRGQVAKLRAAETTRDATSSASDKVSSATSSTSSSSGIVPKKRSASGVEKAEDKDKALSESSSLLDSDDASEADEVEERRKS